MAPVVIPETVRNINAFTQGVRSQNPSADVVVEWGTWARSERDTLRALARRAGALVHLELLDAPLDELWQRVSERGYEQVAGSRAITRDDLVEWSATIERPTDDELGTYDPMPPVRAGELPGSPAFPYGSWSP